MHFNLYLKAFLLTSSATLSFAALVPPKRASERTQKLYTGQLFEYLVRSLAYIACVRVSIYVAGRAADISCASVCDRLSFLQPVHHPTRP